MIEHSVEDTVLRHLHECKISGRTTTYTCPRCGEDYHVEVPSANLLTHNISDCWLVHLEQDHGEGEAPNWPLDDLPEEQ